MKSSISKFRVLHRSFRTSLKPMNEEKPCKCTPDVKPELPEGMGTLETLMFKTLTNELSPISLVIKNDSWKHSHHAPMQGAANTSESHFKVTVVSDKFKGLTPIKRHRLVYSLLTDAGVIGDGNRSDGKVHALQIDAKAP